MSSSILDVLWAQADEFYISDKWTVDEKLRLLTYQEGVFWGYAIATPDTALMQRAFRLREQVAEMLEELLACDSSKA